MLSFLFVIGVVFWGLYTWSRIRKAIHMLQQNGYRNERFQKWMKENRKKVFRKRDFIPLITVLLAFVDFLDNVAILLFIGLYVILYLLRETEKEKKKLVVTARVKRLMTTVILLVVIIAGFGFYFGLINQVALVPLLLVYVILNILSFYVVMAGNTINLPIEKRIAQGYANDAKRIIRQSPDLEVIGITGSYGKTSVKHILNTILSSHSNVLMTPESYNTPMGVTITIRNMLRPFHKYFIAEMGAKQEYDIQEVCDIAQQKYGIITSIGEQHLETFGSLDTIKKTKFELVDSLPDDGIAFLNKDDENSMWRAPKSKARIVYYGIHADDLDYRAENISFSSKGTSFSIVKKDGTAIDIQTKLLGQHNVYNILAAVAAASELGVPEKKIEVASKKIAPVPHRMEIKKHSSNITIIDDAFNSNPVGSKMALDVLGQMEGYKVLITPGMIELGPEEYNLNKKLGQHAAGVCDYIILVGKKQTVPLQDGLKEEQYPEDQYYIARNLDEAIMKMNEITKEKTVVLIENDLPDTFNE
ncbi:UDP-N-acetylmuramoyl-tripeptide--D-alanyl-D-alanine ligase [Pseudalkalibacillus salsuginis]|uniref:UDP-N-acetylmuramoyl-tripeptide--D-alanyl-D- alanine ligase n=1 Tax=Pseudalkalibacillus salsuginis TaxID=2910972 RepID=UPI001F45E38D|nr:UDP-N-acetylmuramoyl-tripeptide--D-alanyl-D-alanine ligase [Pseudalkalibacillus salsuginis]MCF6411267.1 UDP-N-acetylmuramoyl-tripeptide--D-alanyl-D-alanine ligase [Pseudalkalibacillus salsuginis]